MITASVCTIGDEILIGQITDTNTADIARALNQAGVRISRKVSIGDSREEIISFLTEELKTNDIVITTGGLGPTMDDLTKQALFELSGAKGWYKDERQAEINREILHSRGLDSLGNNAMQAMVPDTASVIINKVGTAPILVFSLSGPRFPHNPVLYAMPGVPHETLAALPGVMDDIRSRFRLSAICHRSIMTYGIAESALEEKISPWVESLPEDMHLAYLPNTLTGVRLRLSVYGASDGESAARRISGRFEALKEILGDIIYSDQDDTLQQVIGKILRSSGETLSVAESCTGGEISHLLTTVPGSSEYYLGSVTSYSPEVKAKVLGVSRETIEKEGIVSAAIASEMAEGVRRLTGSTYSLSTTGWADAYGDEKEPAGTVWIAVSGPRGTRTLRARYHNDRQRNIQRFAATALNFLRLYIISGE